MLPSPRAISKTKTSTRTNYLSLTDTVGPSKASFSFQSERQFQSENDNTEVFEQRIKISTYFRPFRPRKFSDNIFQIPGSGMSRPFWFRLVCVHITHQQHIFWVVHKWFCPELSGDKCECAIPYFAHHECICADSNRRLQVWKGAKEEFKRSKRKEMPLHFELGSRAI